MKVTFWEGVYGAEISLTPETVEEMSALARMTINARSEKPEINLYLSEKEPTCSVWVKNVKESVRKTAIRSKKK